jgi:hypothetical protein
MIGITGFHLGLGTAVELEVPTDFTHGPWGKK